MALAKLVNVGDVAVLAVRGPNPYIWRVEDFWPPKAPKLGLIQRLGSPFCYHLLHECFGHGHEVEASYSWKSRISSTSSLLFEVGTDSKGGPEAKIGWYAIIRTGIDANLALTRLSLRIVIQAIHARTGRRPPVFDTHPAGDDNRPSITAEADEADEHLVSAPARRKFKL